MATYVNDLRLKEIGTGESSGTWGTETNVNLELIGDAMGFATKAIANASTATLTMPDGTATNGELRSLYLKLTGGGQACTVTLAPNTVSKVWIIENGTSYTLTFTAGSGANVAVLAGQTKVISSNGGGSGAILYDVMTNLAVAGELNAASASFSGTGAVKLPVGSTGQRPTAAAGQFRYNSTTGKFEGYTNAWGDIGGGEAVFSLSTMTGDGSDTTLSMSVTPASENSIQVYFDGVYQHKDTFSFNNTTLTFSTAPAAGVKVEVLIISTVLASTTPGDGTVTAAKLANDAVTSPKLAHALDVVTSVSVGGASNGVILTQGDIALKNGGTRSTVKFYCESNNAHYAQIQAPAHSAFSGNVTLTLPASTDTLAGIAATQTLTNKTLTTPILTTPVVNAGLQLKNAAASAGFIEFFEDSDNGTNKVTLIGPASTADITLTLPSSAGSSGQSLVTNGSGVLSFATVGGLYNDWLVKTSGYTMVSGDQIVGNHASSAFTLTLPASPSAGAVVTVKNAGAALITIGRNSQKINSQTQDGTLAADAAATLVYVDSTIGWKEL